MKKTIKIIDLLNKIANSEEVPKRIKYCGNIYEYNDEFYYMNGYSLYRDFYTEGNCLNYEVEIIEENKKIEKLDIDKMLQIKKWKRDKNAWKKINELIDEVNKLKEK